MSATKPKVKQFLEDSDKVLTPTSPTKDIAQILEAEKIRQIKDQLSSELAPIRNRLASIEKQQGVIVDLLQKKVDFDPQERRILNLLETLLKKEL